MTPKRLLCCMSSMDTGGAETFLMKQYRSLDRTEYQMDFCVNVSERGYYDNEIEALGGTIYRIPPKSKDFFASLNALKDIVKTNGYEAVLVSSVKPGTALELMAAKQGGATRLIYRSSNSSVDGGAKQKLLHTTIGKLARIVPTVKFAPSVPAAEYCFGKGCVEKGKAQLLHNGIDPSFYCYSPEGRKKARAEWDVSDDCLVLGHIGRFTKAKNHSFLLDVFAKVNEKKSNSCLVLIGQGESEHEIKEKAKQLGILEHIRFTGVRSDIPDLLSGADMFVFPSFYEGMPNTVIEAQALSLPCFVSNRVTADAAITDLVQFLPINDPNEWADAVLACPVAKRREMKEEIEAKGYDIQNVHRSFVKLCYGE
ncbi:MAG TPA: glycosyltransferase family 1 protein [Ruminococcaceae bacterium]|nr:glycosyltransferase family 1 protein [Oscillospiraceae bacterium]